MALKVQVPVTLVLEPRTFKNDKGEEVSYIKTGITLQGDYDEPIFVEFKFVDGLGKYLVRKYLEGKEENKK